MDETMTDPVTRPAHYEGAHGVACMDAMRSMLDRETGLTPAATYWWGCALKYVWRAPLKHGTQDVCKAIQCLTCLLDEMEASHE